MYVSGHPQIRSAMGVLIHHCTVLYVWAVQVCIRTYVWGEKHAQGWSPVQGGLGGTVPSTSGAARGRRPRRISFCGSWLQHGSARLASPRLASLTPPSSPSLPFPSHSLALEGACGRAALPRRETDRAARARPAPRGPVRSGSGSGGGSCAPLAANIDVYLYDSASPLALLVRPQKKMKTAVVALSAMLAASADAFAFVAPAARVVAPVAQTSSALTMGLNAELVKNFPRDFKNVSPL